MTLCNKIATNLGLRKPINQGNWYDFLKADKVKDILPEDVIQIKGKKYLYYGVWPTGLQKNVCKDAHFYKAYFNSPRPNGRNITVFQDFPFWKKVGHMSKEKWINNSRK